MKMNEYTNFEIGDIVSHWGQIGIVVALHNSESSWYPIMVGFTYPRHPSHRNAFTSDGKYVKDNNTSSTLYLIKLHDE